jgi:protein-tyrosine-phosphatase
MSPVHGTPRTTDHPETGRLDHQPISLDQQVALRSAATRLAVEFDGIYGAETVERFLVTSYDEFADRATIVTFLPLLAERFARQRLQALARVEGLRNDGKPVVLFLCTHNAGRSQMALGFFTHHAGDTAVAWSGGSEPDTAVNPAAVTAMAERGIDISTEYPKPWTDEVVRAADVVITMGCGDACPIFPGKRYEEWAVEDPAGKTVEDVRPIRDDLERRVRHLIAELRLDPAHALAPTPAPTPSGTEGAA